MSARHLQVQMEVGESTEDFRVETKETAPKRAMREGGQRLAQAKNATMRFFGVGSEPTTEQQYSYFNRREREGPSAAGQWISQNVSQASHNVANAGRTLVRSVHNIAVKKLQPRYANSNNNNNNQRRESAVPFVDLTAGQSSASLASPAGNRRGSQFTPPPYSSPLASQIVLELQNLGHTRPLEYSPPDSPDTFVDLKDADQEPQTPQRSRPSQEQLYKQQQAREQQQQQQKAKEQLQKRKRSGTFNSTVVNDPYVSAQLAELRPHRPILMMMVSLAQLAMLVYAFYENYVRTGLVMETDPFNFMIGASMTTLVAIGAKFEPCMFPSPFINPPICADMDLEGELPPLFVLPDGESIAVICGDLQAYCGMTTFKEPDVPDQWYRVFTAIFLSGGVVHFLLNMVFQYQTGFLMERDIGFIRIFFIYFISGVGGNLFGSLFSPLSASVGASGALFGLLACLWLDLLQNWKLMKNGWKHLIKLFVITLFALACGLLPFIDNFAHLGGFICGILSGIIFMPSINFGPYDRRRKIILIVVAFPILVGTFFGMIYALANGYDGRVMCPYCLYLDCLPVLDWCALY